MKKIYWLDKASVVFKNPEIFEADLDDGFFIAIPGLIIFNSKREAEEYIEKCHKIILEKRGTIL